MRKGFFITLAAFVLMILSTADAQPANPVLIPTDLAVITPDNIDQVVEIAAIGNGGAGKLFWSPDHKTLAMNNSYGVWLYDTAHLNDEPRFIPEPSLDALIFSDDSSLMVAWQRWRTGDETTPDTPTHVWKVSTAEQVTDWTPTDISENPAWRYQLVDRMTGPMVDRHYQTEFHDIVTNTQLYSYRGSISAFYFSENRAIAAARDEKTFITFDVASGEPLWSYDAYGEPGYVKSFSASGELVLIYTPENFRDISPESLRLRRASDGELVQSLELAGQENYYFPGFTPDDRHIVAYNYQDALIYVWETGTGRLINTFSLNQGFGKSFSNVKLVDNNTLLAGATSEGLIGLYNLLTGEETSLIQTGEVLHDYAYNPDSGYLGTVSETGVLGIQAVDTGKPLLETDRYRVMGDVKAISPDGQTLITMTPSSSLLIWDVPAGQITQVVPYTYSQDAVVVFRPDGELFATNRTGPFSLISGEWFWDFNSLYAVNDISYSPDGKYMAAAAGSLDQDSTNPPIFFSLAIYEANSSRPIVVIPEPRPNGGGFSALAFSPDSRYIAAVAGGIRIWEIEKLLEGDLTPLILLSPDEQTGDIAFSPDGKQIIAGYALLRTGGDGFSGLMGPCTMGGWDLESILKQVQNGENITAETAIESQNCYVFQDTFGPSRFVAYSPAGDMILTYGSDKSWQNWATPMTLLDAVTGDVLRHFWGAKSFVMSPDGTFMISSGGDGRLHYWGIPGNEQP